jgi:hypothetical protein
VRARLKPNVILHDPAAHWVIPARWYEAEWSPAMTSPRRVILIHPDDPGTTIELPGSAVEVER